MIVFQQAAKLQKLFWILELEEKIIQAMEYIKEHKEEAKADNKLF